MHSRIAKFVIPVVAALGTLASTTATAGNELGQACWTFTGFTDTMRCAVTDTGGSGPADIFKLNCRQRAAGSYQLVGSGNLTNSFPTTGSLQVGIAMAHNTTAFGGNRSCVLTAVLAPSTLGGPFTIECPGGTASAKFIVTGTLAFAAPCPAAAAEGGASGAAVGGRP